MTLSEAHTLLKEAKSPEEAFGINGQPNPREAMLARFRELARLSHEDVATDKTLGGEVFRLLGDWRAAAENKMRHGTFGNPNAVQVTMSTKKAVYSLYEDLGAQGVYDCYGGEVEGRHDPLFFRVVANPSDNDLAINEAKRLTWMRSDAMPRKLETLAHITTLVDSFDVKKGRANHRVNVFPRLRGYVTLQTVLDAYPGGIELRSAAWMFRRLLAALVCVHESGLVHGAVLPENFWIRPDRADDPDDPRPDDVHNGILTEFSFCVEQGQVIKAVVPERRALYSADVFDKKPADPGVDLHLAAQTFCLLVGGIQKLPASLAGLMRACFLAPSRRTRDIFELYSDFDVALKSLYGKPRFHRFLMPTA